MDSMQIIEVVNSKTEQEFLMVPVAIYKEDANWIRPLDNDIQDIFDKEKSKPLQSGGVAKRWILKKGDQSIGRIAAFINPNYKESQPTGGIGFFECIDDEQAAHLLFDIAKEWLQSYDMQAMDGPINFGERDSFWGLLVEGFHEPLYKVNYNPEYYQYLFESYGFQNYFDQLCYSLPLKAEISSRLEAFHQRILTSNNYEVEHLKKSNIDKYIQDFYTVYNDAWATHGGGKQLTLSQAKQIFKSMKPVIEEKLVWFVYHNNRPVAFWVNIPDLNQHFKKMKGKFGILQKLYFLYLLKFTKVKKIVGIVFGVVQEFQGRGVDAFMIIEGRKVMARDTHYDEYEMQWIGDFNPKMIKVVHLLGANLSRKLTTYRLLFDKEQSFERHRML